MEQSRFPEGWNEDRVTQLLSSYEAPADEEAVAEDEAGLGRSETVMSVPYELVPKVRELIAKGQAE